MDALRGLNISITTTAKTDEEPRRFARFPFPVQELRLSMAKVTLIQRELKREKLAAKYAAKSTRN